MPIFVVRLCENKKETPKTLLFFLKSLGLSDCVRSVDQALTTLAMRKFCEDKVSSSLQPSQNR